MAGSDGEITAFHNACRHRGNKLIEERRGNKPGVIRCAYHSWCYNQDGSLRAAPRTENLENFKKKDWGLRNVRLEIFASFVFITLDENARPVAEIANGADIDPAGLELVLRRGRTCGYAQNQRESRCICQ